MVFKYQYVWHGNGLHDIGQPNTVALHSVADGARQTGGHKSCKYSTRRMGSALCNLAYWHHASNAGMRALRGYESDSEGAQDPMKRFGGQRAVIRRISSLQSSAAICKHGSCVFMLR